MKKKLLSMIDSADLFSVFNLFTRSRVPVFLMHHFCGVGMREGGPLPPLPADFLDDCLGYLKKNNYSVIPLSEYVNNMIKGAHLYKTVVFTVDDGYQDFYDHAYPVFKKYDMPAAVFIVSDFIDGKIRLWWDEIEYAVNNTVGGKIDISVNGEKIYYPLGNREEKAYAINRITERCKMIPDENRRAIIKKMIDTLDAGASGDPGAKTPKALNWKQILEMRDCNIEFFPHTKTHPVLARCTEETIRSEVSESKRNVETKLGKAANIFCYPNGRSIDFDDRAITLLKQAGYIAAFTVEEGYDNTRQKIDLFRLRRFFFPDDFLLFKRLVSGLEAFRMSTRKFF